MSLTLERIEAIAPDQASLSAARKLLKPATWPTLAAAEGLIWGECQGSGSTPYRVVVFEADAGYKCTCPSRKFPCKHSLGLMWLRVEGKVSFAPAAVPEWVNDWLSRRRGSALANQKPTEAETSRPSIRLTKADEATATDPKAEARAAAARERNRLEREAAILAGLDDLELWLKDQVERGMATFVAQSAKECRGIAQRLVDSKAPGLATRLDALPTRLFTLPEAARPYAAVQELGQVHLIAEAYRRQAEMPPPLALDVRRAVGWTVAREALLADETALRVTANWRVVATVSEVQPDRLRRVETWLWRETPVESEGQNPRVAVLIDFIPVATGAAASGYTTGDRISAELAFYPSATPQRAQIVSITGETQYVSGSIELPPGTLKQAFEDYQQAMARLPWLDAWPLSFRSAQVRRSGEALFLADSEGGFVLPLQSSQAMSALPLTAAGVIDGIGLWNGYHFTLCWAHTALGRWVNA